MFPDNRLVSHSTAVILSLDDAGKTTLFNRLVYADTRETSTTIGFNVDTMSTLEHRLVTMWDLGGRKELRPLWQPYVDTAHMILFPIDVSNGKRMEEAQQELVRVVTELCPKENVPVLLIAMKRDKENAMSMEEFYASMSGILKPVMQGSQSSRVIEYVPYGWNNEEDKQLILNWIGFNARQHCHSIPLSALSNGQSFEGLGVEHHAGKSSNEEMLAKVQESANGEMDSDFDESIF